MLAAEAGLEPADTSVRVRHFYLQKLPGIGLSLIVRDESRDGRIRTYETLRLPCPKHGALTRLSYIPMKLLLRALHHRASALRRRSASPLQPRSLKPLAGSELPVLQDYLVSARPRTRTENLWFLKPAPLANWARRAIVCHTSESARRGSRTHTDTPLRRMPLPRLG